MSDQVGNQNVGFLMTRLILFAYILENTKTEFFIVFSREDVQRENRQDHCYKGKRNQHFKAAT